MPTILKENPITVTDFYKICHKDMYPEGMTKLYSTWTPRSNKFFPYSNEVVWFGLQGFIKTHLIDFFNNQFFNQPIEEIVADFKEIVGNCFDQEVTTKHIEDLHKLGYVPIAIKALPEGMLVPINMPMMTIENTHKDFAWLTNYLETFISQNLWSPTTTATIAYVFNQTLQKYLEICGEEPQNAKNLFGDFSPRGMSSGGSSQVAGAGHLLSSIKTSSIESIRYLINTYGADLRTEKVGEWSASVEHSCVCSNFFINNDNEEIFFERLLTEVYPTKPFTYVADSFDFWDFVASSLPKFKSQIIKRDNAKICIRPDSGVPELILCGDPQGETELERKGLVEVLWDIFGGTINQKGFKKLDDHIGVVYGDSITIDRCKTICERLVAKGFCINNVVFGVGSYTYNMISRDTLGHALKATYCEIEGRPVQIYKNPKTDKDAMKKSQKGKVAIVQKQGRLVLIDQLDSKTEEKIDGNLLQTVFKDGELVKQETLNAIRNRLHPFDATVVTKKLILWIKDYFEKNGPKSKAIIGISGGKDSSVVAAACVKALGKENVFGVLMPSGVQEDIQYSYDLCHHLEIEYTVINIGTIIKEEMQALEAVTQQLGRTSISDVTRINTPARIRMATLYGVAGLIGGRVANTCNLSEDWVGYSTKFGDSAGDFSPLSSLTVKEVKMIGRELGLPEQFIEKTPIDGLCGKTDEENLGFTYEVLDRYIREGVCTDENVKMHIDQMHDRNQHKLLPMPHFEP